MIEQYHPVFSEADQKAVSDVIASGWINEGKLTQKFEQRFAEMVGSRYAVACANGTLAIYMALSVIDPQQSLALPATSAIGDVRATQMAGIDFSVEDTLPYQPTLEAFNPRSTPLNVSVNGYFDPPEHGSVEDACQSLGSKHVGKQIGTFARIGCFSLAPSKIITCGQGGVCVTDDRVLYEAMAAFKDHGRVRDYKAKTQSNRYAPPGTNLKFDDIKAALALSQLSRLDERIQHKQETYGVYKEILGENIMSMEKNELPWYPMLRAPRIEKVVSMMAERGIQLKQFPETVTTQMGGKQAYGNADAFHEYCAYLPCSPDLSIDDAIRVALELKAVL
jgi:perosamine synthetase